MPETQSGPDDLGVAAADSQATLLRAIVDRLPLGDVLERLVRAIELRAPGLIASVLLVQDGRLHLGAAPNLPDGYNRAADNHPIGEGYGSCGTAAHRHRPVIVEDIQSDPLWKNYREIARRYHLGSCWSMPIFDASNEVIGTFALYHHEPRRPRPDELALIRDFAQLAAVAIVHHRAHEALRASLEERRALVDDAQVIVWEATAERRQFTTVSPAAERLLGYSIERWTGEPGFWASIVHPEDLEATLRRDAEALRAGSGKHQAEYRVRAAGGGLVWIRDVVTALGDGVGHPAHLRGVMTDISRQREAEQERDELLRQLADEKGLLRAVFAQLPEGALVVSTDGTVLSANEQARRLLRFTVEGGGELIDRLHPWTHGRELTLVGTDGERHTIAVCAGPVRDRRERVVATVAVLSDETGRKHAGVAQRLLADAGSTVGSSLDPDTTVGSVAALAVREFADWCLIFTQTESGGLHCAALAHHDPANPVQASDFERTATQPGGIPFGVSALLAGGPPQLLRDFGPDAFQPGAARPELARMVRQLGVDSALVAPLRVRDRTVGAIVFGSAGQPRYQEEDLAVAEELARRTALALENARLYRQAQAGIRQREEFLSIAAHELKTPLGSLQLTVQSMADVLGSPQPDLEFVRGRAEAGQRQGARLARLVDELLDVSAIQAGRVHLAPETIDLTATIDTVVNRFQDELERRGVDVTVHAPEPVVGRWDPSRLEQVLTNLLSNALKYGQGRPVRVAVKATSEVATLHVEDQGIGMSPDVIARIFNPFERGVPAGHYGGLGLGLYITDQIVRAQGGTISVRSAPARGAVFTVELPRNVATNSEPSDATGPGA